MELVSLGTALVDCARLRTAIEALGERLLFRAYTQAELEYCNGRPHATECFAAVWAAKDAVLKCLGVRAGGPERGLVEITFNGPEARAAVHGPLRDRARAAGITGFLLATAHTRLSATATAVAYRGAAGTT